ncbi:WD repeat-containing protein 43-like [Littorina saxatilis]|uniref:Small-subunit processome Utp12 domain-containing protein n=1 Tax=Littorina saxatilis TaxID=31220 RepID=A0AAN9BHF5_9CAEN
MAGLPNIASSFSPKGDYLAYAGFDGVLKIWETTTGNSVADFSPSKHLTATCTCLQWGPGRHLKSPHTPRKKKKRKSDVEAAVGSLDLVAMGTTSGTVLLYSFARGQVHTHLEKGHTDQVTDVCWHPDGTTLYSSSLDGHVVEWDVASSQVREKWKASSGGVHSMCLCSSSRLLTADRVIKMWDLATRTLIQKFTGHSTEVFRLLPVLKSSSEGNDDGDQCSYFLSSAANDRVVNAWYCHPDGAEKNAITSFSLSEEPVDLSLSVSKDQMVTLAVLTTGGKVLVFEHRLNGKLKKPLKPKTVVHAATTGSREDVPLPVPVLAALPRETSEHELLLAHGSALKPKFETVALKPSRPEIVLIVASPAKKVAKGEFTQVKTPDVGGGSVLYPSQMVPLGPAKDTGTRRKRKESASELTLEDRLQAMGVDKPNQASSSGATRPPKADQLVVQLTQGLQSKDTKLMTNVFQERNESVIVNTVKRLPLHVIIPLIKEITQRMHGHPQSGLLMVRWMKQILSVHMAFLMTVPEVMDSLGELYQMIEYRTKSLPQRIAQQGRLHMLLSRIASQTQEEDEPAADVEPLLVYQDESSDEDVPMEFGASESEDNWDDMDD